MRATYDTDAIRASAQRIDAAAGQLKGVGNLLRSMPPGSCPRGVEDALEDLGKRGADMIEDIQAEATVLGEGLRRTAETYDDLENSIVKQFGGG